MGGGDEGGVEGKRLEAIGVSIYIVEVHCNKVHGSTVFPRAQRP